jgi:hypothetical protein
MTHEKLQSLELLTAFSVTLKSPARPRPWAPAPGCVRVCASFLLRRVRVCSRVARSNTCLSSANRTFLVFAAAIHSLAVNNFWALVDVVHSTQAVE